MLFVLYKTKKADNTNKESKILLAFSRATSLKEAKPLIPCMQQHHRLPSGRLQATKEKVNTYPPLTLNWVKSAAHGDGQHFFYVIGMYFEHSYYIKSTTCEAHFVFISKLTSLFMYAILNSFISL